MVTTYTFLSHISACSSSSRSPELGSSVIKSIERNWFRRRAYHALNILNYVRHIISSTTELGLSLIRSSSLTKSELCQTLICDFINADTDADTIKIVTTINDSSVTMSAWSSAKMWTRSLRRKKNQIMYQFRYSSKPLYIRLVGCRSNFYLA